ncbi:MAG: HEAT repeat domain-containing protein, partial [Planctomycetota bacterium]|nr:HEAT repeat domain-containing protein [Planctomycetota bacterium]
MRKIITSVLVLSALGACSSTPSEEERGEELYLRLRYLRAAFETAYADHSSATLDTVSREIKSYARNDLNLFVQDVRKGPLWKKEIAAFVLGFSTNKKAQAGLIVATRDPDLNVRGIALASLGFMRMADTPLDVFRKNLNSPHWYLRQAALYGLRYQLNAGETGGMVSSVIKRLRDSQMDVRNEALIVLRRMKSKESLSSIISVSLKDDHPHVRQSAAITLSAFGEEGSEAVPSLVETLRDADTKVV